MWIFKTIIINAATLFITAKLIPSLDYSDSNYILVKAAIILGIANLLVKPILKLISLPFNFLTLGLFSWIIDVVTLYIAIYFVKGLSFTGINLSQIFGGFLPFSGELSKFPSLILLTFVIGLISSLISRILK